MLLWVLYQVICSRLLAANKRFLKIQELMTYLLRTSFQLFGSLCTCNFSPWPNFLPLSFLDPLFRCQVCSDDYVLGHTSTKLEEPSLFSCFHLCNTTQSSLIKCTITSYFILFFKCTITSYFILFFKCTITF